MELLFKDALMFSNYTYSVCVSNNKEMTKYVGLFSNNLPTIQVCIFDVPFHSD